MPSQKMLDRVYFYNGQPTAGRQVVDDLQRQRLPDWAIDALTDTLVPFDWDEKVHPRGEAGKFAPKEGGSAEAATKETATGVNKPSDGDSSDGEKAQKAQEAGQDIKQKPIETSAHASAMESQLAEMHQNLSSQYEARGESAALAVAEEGVAKAKGPISQALSDVKEWAGQKVDSALNEVTDWARALVGDPKKSIGADSDKDPGEGVGMVNEAIKAMTATAVRLATNPLIELPRLGVNMISGGTQKWGFVDHDAKDLQEKWGTKTANLVIASGVALGTGVAAAGLVAGLMGGGLAVAGAAAGVGALLNYCPGFRAWVSRAPAKLLLAGLNSYGLKDTLAEKKALREAKENRKRQAMKDDFDAKARKAGFSRFADDDSDDKKVPSPEKIREIAREFFAKVQKKFLEEYLLKDKKVCAALKNLGEAFHADPKAVEKAIKEFSREYPLKGKAGKAGFSMPDPVFYNGRIVERRDALRQLREAGVPRDMRSLCLREV